MRAFFLILSVATLSYGWLNPKALQARGLHTRSRTSFSPVSSSSSPSSLFAKERKRDNFKQVCVRTGDALYEYCIPAPTSKRKRVYEFCVRSGDYLMERCFSKVVDSDDILDVLNNGGEGDNILHLDFTEESPPTMHDVED